MWRWLVGALILLLVACTPTPVPTPRNIPIQVDNVEVLIMESFPVRVSVRVQGALGDGCMSAGPVTQVRNGDTVEVTVMGTHSGAEVCTMIMQMYDQTIALEGDFPPGEYIVRVNGVERSFRV